MPRLPTLNVAMTGVALVLADLRCDSVIFENLRGNATAITIREVGAALILSILNAGERLEVKGMRNLNEFDANGALNEVLSVRAFLT